MFINFFTRARSFFVSIESCGCCFNNLGEFNPTKTNFFSF